MVQITQFHNWGNDLGVLIPKHSAVQAGFDENTCIEIIAEENTLCLRRCESAKKYTLTELVQKITPENQHDAIDFHS